MKEIETRAGVRPGLRVVAERTGHDVRMTTSLGEVDLPALTAHHVFVDPLDDRRPDVVGVS